LLLGAAGWRWLFWINVPAGVLGLISGWFLLPRTRNRRPSSPVDWRGLGLFLAATSLVMLALSIAEHRSALVIAAGLLALAVLVATALVRRERRTIAPLFDAVLLRSRRFTSGLVAGLFAYATLFGVLVVTPFYLAAARHASPEAVGLQLAALPVALGLVAPIAGHAADRVSARRITMLGLSVAALGFVALSLWHGSTPGLVAGLAVVGLGLGLFTPANNVSVMGAAPADYAGAAAGILNMTRGLGTALGVAAAGLTYALVAGGPHASPAAAGRGLTATTVLLAGLALLAVGTIRVARRRTSP
jgi:MFS family permease